MRLDSKEALDDVFIPPVILEFNMLELVTLLVVPKRLKCALFFGGLNFSMCLLLHPLKINLLSPTFILSAISCYHLKLVAA